jgi:DNA-binding MarR family transcriptional regulator
MPQNLELIALLKALRHLARALDIHSSRINRESGLTLPQLLALTCVRDLGETTSRAISVAVDLSPPTVVGILDKLEAKGLIERYRSTTDRRIVHTQLTNRGRKLLESAPTPMGADFEANFMKLTQSERSRLLGAIQDIAALTTTGRQDLEPDTQPIMEPQAR